MRTYQICKRCIMDTSASEISFNDKGICSFCDNFDTNIAKKWFPNEEGRKKLEQIVDKIKCENKDKEYDCIIGLSGGVDSSYLAYIARKVFNLRMLAVHVDAGWNSEIAVKNIETLVKKLGIDLYTHVVNWEEIKDLQVAYLKSGLANQDVPQDHIFFSVLYDYAHKNGIKYVLHGGNYATESIFPKSWGYKAMDAKQLKAVHKRFGKVKLKSYKTVGFFKYEIYYPTLLRMKVVRMLNFLQYNKEEAIRTLESELGWKYYGGKHYESRFTKFFQSYYLPKRFGFDKRRSHLSSLIISGQMSREDALKEMTKPAYSETELKEDSYFVAKKLGVSVDELNQLLVSPIKTFQDYPSNYSLDCLLNRLKAILRKIRRA